MDKKYSRETLCVQAGWTPKKGEPRVLPIYQSTTFKYDTSEQMARLFDLEDSGYFYTRLQNPTNDAVAAKIAALEGGVGAMLTSSGQAANFYAIFNICQAGDHFVCSSTIYGGTFNLFGVTLKKLGIECTFIDANASEEEIDQAFRPNTKALFGETISNPSIDVLDIEKFARIAHKHGVPLIVDNTFATPINCRPFEWGADIVTHSTTKYMDGHATSVGGAIVDSGNFDWEAHADKFPGLTQPDESYHGLTYTKAFGKMAYMTKATAQLMRDLGSNFDVASDGEIMELSSLGVDGSRMIYANPMKTVNGLRACRNAGVGKMTFDSAGEIDKMARECPGATVLLRIRIDNSSAHVDLNKKFGAAREQALELLLKARDAGLDAAGIAFHVGSQTTSADPYLYALDIAREIFEEAAAAGMQLRIMDIGGGFPIPEPKVRFNLQEMLNQINARLDEDFPGVEIWAEPGRFICGTAVNLITSVIGVTERGGQPWYFLDEGLYGTFSGVLFDQWDFKLISFKEGEQVAATFAGPSCDSLDIMFRGKMTVRQEEGDLILVPICGAYTSASATTFNGFSKANFVVWEDVKETLMAPQLLKAQ